MRDAAKFEKVETRVATHSLRLRLLEARAAAAQGPKGDPGPPGPVGPTPDHRWVDTALQFERPNGEWGELVELRGPKGERGERGFAGGGIGPQGPQGAPGGGSASSFAPVRIPAGQTFVVPQDAQVLFAMNIDNEGYIDASLGYLVEV